MVLAMKAAKVISSTNARLMLPLVKTMFTLDSEPGQQPGRALEGQSLDPTFALFRAGMLGIAIWPVLAQSIEPQMMNQEFAEVDEEGDPVTCAADPYVFAARGPGGDDLLPLVGFIRGAPVWAERQGDFPGTGSGLPYWLRENMLFMDSANVPRERVREAAALVFSRGVPEVSEQGNVSATRSDQPDGDEPPPCRGPMCEALAPATLDTEFCATCITRVMQLQVVLPQTSTTFEGSWAEVEARYVDLMEGGQDGRSSRNQPEHALLTPGRQRWIQLMEENGIHGQTQQAEFEQWQRRQRNANP